MKNLSDPLKKFIAGMLGNLAVLILSAVAVSDVFRTFSNRAKAITILGGLVLFLSAIRMFPNRNNFDIVNSEGDN